MSEPQCRGCYLLSLTPAERERAVAEGITSTVHYCDKHDIEKMLTSANTVLMKARKADRAYKFQRHLRY